jgi:hypothetical protein
VTTEPFHRTGVFATEAEKARLMDIAARATCPVMLPYMDDDVDWVHRGQEVCHTMALAHGLPDVPGYYGVTTPEGEFVCAKEGIE